MLFCTLLLLTSLSFVSPCCEIFFHKKPCKWLPGVLEIGVFEHIERFQDFGLISSGPRGRTPSTAVC